MTTAEVSIDANGPSLARTRGASVGIRLREFASGHPLFTGSVLAWLPIAAAIVTMSGLVYLTTQQSIRSGANDPQLQMAGDLAAQLARGGDAKALVGAAQVDLATSLAPFVTVFDGQGAVVTSTAELDGRVPVPPGGVLDAARNGRNALTWQPRSGVRTAIVVVPYRIAGVDGRILVGRSMREIEDREQLMLVASAAGMVGGLAAAFVCCLLAVWCRRAVFGHGRG